VSHSKFKSWSAIIRINTEGKFLIMKLGPGDGEVTFTLTQKHTINHQYRARIV